MDAIFSSKLYKASSRKERIKAAFWAPGNVSLVQQLSTNLDEEYQTPENLGKEEEAKSADVANNLFVDEEINPETDLVTVDDFSKSSKGGSSSHHSSGGGSVPTGTRADIENRYKSDDSAGPDSSDGGSAPNTSEGSDEDKPEPEETEASTKIQSCSQVNLTVLKESLNSREDTHGVLRVAEKEEEIWLYYNDDINLNNVMTEVIEYMINTGYVNLEFNRLARSDNAIVFVKVNEAKEIGDQEAEESESKEEILEENNLEPAEE